MKKLTPENKIIKGFKATDENMCCRGFQFELNKWYTHKGELELCVSGFHFCEYPSGPWAYYNSGRLFAVEAKEVLLSDSPGADKKHVAKKIRLIEEIKIGGNGNTGDRNIGNRNTGDWNTGDRNTGDWNTGNWNTGNGNTGDGNTGNGNTGDRNIGNRNTGDWNTGDRNIGNRNIGNRNTGNRNTGNRNTGNRNTGNRNTGDRNTGNGNTGNRNTGNRNTGDGNIGDRNTGDGNTGSYHSGYLNFGKAPFYIFNKIADIEKVDFDLVYKLCNLLLNDDVIDPTPFLSLPNASKKAIKDLHNAHIEARKK